MKTYRLTWTEYCLTGMEIQDSEGGKIKNNLITCKAGMRAL
jgi:hypothetical protein